MADRRRYRFRTKVLTGPWRPTAIEAIADAIRAGQATRASEREEGFRWIVPGEIEIGSPSREDSTPLQGGD